MERMRPVGDNDGRWSKGPLVGPWILRHSILIAVGSTEGWEARRRRPYLRCGRLELARSAGVGAVVELLAATRRRHGGRWRRGALVAPWILRHDILIAVRLLVWRLGSRAPQALPS